jgi:alpha-2-macroglobulin
VGPQTGSEIGRRVNNAAVETATEATFTTNYIDKNVSLVLSSNQRSDAIVLDALITKDGNSPLIRKVVIGLLADRVDGQWDSMQANTFVLVALRKYFDTYESQTPDFAGRVWLGNRFAGEQEFRGRSTDRRNLALPTSELVIAGNTSIVIAKEGQGRLYYRLGMRYAPTDLKSDPLDRGFVVSRAYEAVDNPSDVRRNADGTWTIKAGARVRVRITMVAESQRTRMALVDKLPAGLEILNPDLATTEALPDDPNSPQTLPKYGWWWLDRWFDHQNLKDDRAEAFATLLSAGTYDWSYVARATTPGTFVVPPAKAEQIYAPETFGRSGSDTVIVEE